MRRFLNWATVPAMIIAFVLERWFGHVGLFITLVLLLLGMVAWIRFFDN